MKLKIVDSNLCTFCLSDIENIFHLFWDCQKTRKFWNNLNEMLCISLKQNFTEHNIFYGNENELFTEIV